MQRPRDTSPDAQARVTEELRRMSPEERLAAAADASAAVRALAEAGIRARHPEYSDREVGAAVAKILLREDRRSRAGPPSDPAPE